MNRDPVGIMDSGIGGLTVAAEFRRVLPGEPVLYIGDTARNPYGEKTPEEIRTYAQEVKEFLLTRHVKMIIIACNTITLNVFPEFYEGTVPVIGMSLDFSSLPDTGRIGIFATPASIACHSHREALAAACPHAEIIEIPCGGLAHAIETGESEDRIGEMIRRLIVQYQADGLDAGIFGCTHYPLMRRVFERVLPQTVFFDPARGTAQTALKVLKAGDALSGTPGVERYCFTAGADRAAVWVHRLFGDRLTVEKTTVAGE